MSRRKSIITKRCENVLDVGSQMKVQTRKRKSPIDLDSEGSDDCEWEPIQSNPKMMKITRRKPLKVSVLESQEEDDFEMTVDASKHCTNRSALMARRNRIKKKMYVEKLENTIQELQENFKSMQKQINKQNEVIAQVTKENKYLRNVITNSSGLRQILQGVRLAGLAHPIPSTQQKPTSADSNVSSVHVTEISPSEDAYPTSTTQGSLSNDSWDMSEVKPVIPVHDYSSNPQLYYDTVPERRSQRKQYDLEI